MNALTKESDRRMTVREVSEALGVSEDSVLRSGKRLYPEAIQNGRTTYFDAEQVTRIKQELQGHHNLRSTAELDAAITDIEMVERAASVVSWAMAKIEEQKQALAAAAPKIEFFDAVADSKDAITMREVAAALNLPGWGRNRIFDFLRKQEVLDNHNLPYRYFQDKGYFRVVERKWADNSGESHVSLTTLVYQKGIDFIRKLIVSEAAA